MKRLLLAAALTLCGCSEGKQFVTRDEATDIADDSVDASGLEGRIAELESRVEELEGETRTVRTSMEITRDLALSTADQAAHNAKVANENAVKDMTRRGACGTELVQLENGGWLNRVKPCTIDDLKK